MVLLFNGTLILLTDHWYKQIKGPFNGRKEHMEAVDLSSGLELYEQVK